MQLAWEGRWFRGREFTLHSLAFTWTAGCHTAGHECRSCFCLSFHSFFLLGKFAVVRPLLQFKWMSRWKEASQKSSSCRRRPHA